MKKSETKSDSNIDAESPTIDSKNQRTKSTFASKPNSNTSRIELSVRSRNGIISKMYLVLSVWLIFEILLCFVALYTRDSNHVENFLHFLCANNRCPNYLETALYGRIILSIIALVGIVLVRETQFDRKKKYSIVCIPSGSDMDNLILVCNECIGSVSIVASCLFLLQDM